MSKAHIQENETAIVAENIKYFEFLEPKIPDHSS
jgi:hypothetical protein